MRGKAPRRLPRRRRPPRRSRQSKSGAGQGSLRRCSRRVSLVNLVRCAAMDSAESLAGSISNVRPRQPVRSLTQPTPSWGSHFPLLRAFQGKTPLRGPADTKTPERKTDRAQGPPWGGQAFAALALGVLRTLTRLTQTDLLPLHGPSIARHKAGRPEGLAQGLVELNQRAADAVPDGAGLAGGAATANGHEHVEPVSHFRELQGLHHHHARRLTTKELIEGLVVHQHPALTGTEENARRGSLPTPGSVIAGPTPGCA